MGLIHGGSSSLSCKVSSFLSIFSRTAEYDPKYPCQDSSRVGKIPRRDHLQYDAQVGLFMQQDKCGGA